MALISAFKFLCSKTIIPKNFLIEIRALSDVYKDVHSDQKRVPVSESADSQDQNEEHCNMPKLILTPNADFNSIGLDLKQCPSPPGPCPPPPPCPKIPPCPPKPKPCKKIPPLPAKCPIPPKKCVEASKCPPPCPPRCPPPCPPRCPPPCPPRCPPPCPSKCPPPCPPRCPPPCPPRCPPPCPSKCPPPCPSKCPPPCPPSPCPPPCCPSKSCSCGISPATCGKVAVVTGGARGIGYFGALALLRNGARVMLGDTEVALGKEAICKIIDKFGPNKAAFVKCDVSKRKDMECLFNAAMCEYKQIDIVFNNAGILRDKEWEKMVDINVKGLVQGTLLGFQYMRKNRNGGTIINNASILGHQPFPGSPVYTATKHFVVGFTRSMGSDFYYNQTGVKVMNLCPGFTGTVMIDECQEYVLEGFQNLGKLMKDDADSYPKQSAEECGNHLITILENDVNGSNWISEAGEVYQIDKVDRHLLRIC